MDIIDTFKEVRECDYKDEHYLVRDNGAVLRLPKNPNKPRKLDNIWTFGKKSTDNGYMFISNHRVHIIVARAYHGVQDSQDYVVDHIDTNRCNNRPENLRWLTKLENMLANPITLQKVLFICGSIESFLNDPAQMGRWGDQSYEWMRTITPSEAENAYINLKRYYNIDVKNDLQVFSLRNSIGMLLGAKTFLKKADEIHPKQEGREKPSSDPELILKQMYGINNSFFRKPSYASRTDSSYPHHDANEQNYFAETSKEPEFYESLTDTAIQSLNWRTPTEFPLCPNNISETPMEDYLQNLKEGDLLCKNKNAISYIEDFALNKERVLVVACSLETNSPKAFSTVRISFEHGKFLHDGVTYFQEDAMKRDVIIARGEEWTGGDVFDDFC